MLIYYKQVVFIGYIISIITILRVPICYVQLIFKSKGTEISIVFFFILWKIANYSCLLVHIIRKRVISTFSR